MKYFILATLAVGLQTSFARDGYVIESVNLRPNGEFCILERSLDKNTPGVIHCAEDHQRDPVRADNINKRIKTLFNSEAKKSLITRFLDTRAEVGRGTKWFTIDQFEKYMDSLESPACKTAITSAEKRKLEIEKKIKELQDAEKSNQQTIINSCNLSTAAPAQNTPARR